MLNADFGGFRSTNVVEEVTETVVGGAVAIECDFKASNPPPIVQWYGDGIAINESKNLMVRYLEGGRYLYIEQVSAAQRMMRFHCEINNFRDESNSRPRSPITYLLNRDLSAVGFTEYLGLGTKNGRVNDTIQFAYVAGSRNANGNFVRYAIQCLSTPFLLFSIATHFVSVTIGQQAASEDEITFECNVISTIAVQIRGTVRVLSK